MNLTGKFYINVSKRAMRAYQAIPRSARPIWRRVNKTIAHSQQEEAD
jgi:hypothetical protein